MEVAAWARQALTTLSPCAPHGELGWSFGAYAHDNCYFGPPAALDATLAALDENHSVVYGQAKALGLYLPHPEVQLPVAAALSGVATWQACHADVLRYTLSL